MISVLSTKLPKSTKLPTPGSWQRESHLAPAGLSGISFQLFFLDPASAVLPASTLPLAIDCLWLRLCRWLTYQSNMHVFVFVSRLDLGSWLSGSF